MGNYETRKNVEGIGRCWVSTARLMVQKECESVGDDSSVVCERWGDLCPDAEIVLTYGGCPEGWEDGVAVMWTERRVYALWSYDEKPEIVSLVRNP